MANGLEYGFEQAHVVAGGGWVGCGGEGAISSGQCEAAFLAGLGHAAGPFDWAAQVEGALDALADHLEAHLDVGRLLGLAA